MKSRTCDSPKRGGRWHGNAPRTHERNLRTRRVCGHKEPSGPHLLGTSLMGKYVERFLPSERKIVPYTSQPVRLLMAHEASVDNWTKTQATNIGDGSVLAVGTERNRHAVRVARAASL